MNMTRVVALGDSLSEGIGDPGRGWIHYLTADPQLTLVANLSRAGSTVSAVLRHQVDRVAAHAPDLVTCVIGVNDVLTRGFDLAAFERDYTHLISALSAYNVLTVTLHDVASGLPLPRAKRTALRDRTAAANEVVERVSAQHGAWMLDSRGASPLKGMLSLDRLHPNARGHRYIAAHALDVLRAHGVAAAGPTATVPPADPVVDRITTSARHLMWLGRHLTSTARRN